MLVLQEISGYILIGLIMMAVLAIMYLPVFLVLRKRVAFARQAVYFLFGVCIIVILSATVIIGFEIVPARNRFLNLVPFKVFTEEWEMGLLKQFTQTLANVVMFVPLGFIFPLAFDRCRKLYKTTIYMAAFSFLIEFVQYFTGRSSDIDDIMLNTLGGVLGYLLFALLSKLFGNRKFWKKLEGL